jgi:hypothetical protein
MFPPSALPQFTTKGAIRLAASWFFSPDPLGDPPALPVRQKKFEIFGGVFHSLFVF